MLLYYVILYYIILYCIIYFYIRLYYITLNCILLYSTIPYATGCIPRLILLRQSGCCFLGAFVLAHQDPLQSHRQSRLALCGA